MKMKRIIMCMLLLVIFSCVACSKNNKNKQTINGTQMSDEKNYNQLQAQANVFAAGAFSEQGYYYINGNTLFFYDLGNETEIPVCSKMNCNHSDSACDAYIDGGEDYDPYDLTGVSLNCLGRNIWYEDGKLYMIKRDESGDYLMEYDKTFLNETNVCTVANDGEIEGLYSEKTQNTCILYDGYLYYFSVRPVHANDMVDYTIETTCNRIKVEKDAKPETLGTFRMAVDYHIFNSFSLAKICVGNDMVYFVCGGTDRKIIKTDMIQYRVYAYEISSGKFTEIVNKNTDDPYEVLGANTGNVQNINTNACSDKNDNLYIATDTCIVRITKNGEIKSIYKNLGDVGSLQWYGDYIYFYEASMGYGNIVKMDSEGNVIGRYEIRGNEERLGNDLNTTMISVTIMGVDDENILISTKLNCIEGLVTDKKPLTNREKFDKLELAIGIVKQEAFEDKDIPIKSIYIYRN